MPLWIKTIPWITAAGLFGAAPETIDGARPISVHFSTQSHNRIAVEEGSIEKVFGDGALFSITLDPLTGNAFVNVLKEIGDTPSTLSVVTGSGLVQDLLVSSRSGPSEQILLREPAEGERFQQDLTLAGSVNVLNQIFEEKIPFGYGRTEAAKPLDLPAPLASESVLTVEGPFETIELHRISNTGKEQIVLSAAALKKERGDWAFIKAAELPPGEDALCLIGHAKEGCGR